MKKLQTITMFMPLFFTLTVITTPALADAESERANLARLVGELDHLLVSLSAYRVDASQRRYVFNYEALSMDLQAMRKGIVEYINKDLSLARTIPPLVTQYVQQSTQRTPGDQ